MTGYPPERHVVLCLLEGEKVRKEEHCDTGRYMTRESSQITVTYFTPLCCGLIFASKNKNQTKIDLSLIV